MRRKLPRFSICLKGSFCLSSVISCMSYSLQALGVKAFQLHYYFFLVQVFQRPLSMSTQKGSCDHKFHICWQNTLLKNTYLLTESYKKKKICHSPIKALQVTSRVSKTSKLLEELISTKSLFCVFIQLTLKTCISQLKKLHFRLV